MERLTIRTNEASISFECESVGDIVRRLAAIEDILGDEYDLDRLRELVEADKTLKEFAEDVARQFGYHGMTPDGRPAYTTGGLSTEVCSMSSPPRWGSTQTLMSVEKRGPSQKSIRFSLEICWANGARTKTETSVYAFLALLPIGRGKAVMCWQMKTTCAMTGLLRTKHSRRIGRI